MIRASPIFQPPSSLSPGEGMPGISRLSGEELEPGEVDPAILYAQGYTQGYRSPEEMKQLEMRVMELQVP